MESPGEYLKRERELRGISLEKVHEVTRIQAKYLDALEADDYAKLPAPAFVKGFIRAYCKYLGVDEDDAVLRYEIFLREQGGEEEAAPAEPTAEEMTAGPHKANTRNIILLVAAGVVIIIAIYIFSSMKGGEAPDRDYAPDAVEAPAPASVEEAPEPEVVEEAPEAEPAIPAPAPKPAPAPAPRPEPAPAPAVAPAPRPPAPAPEPATGEKKAEGRYALTIEASETVWMEISIDNEEPFDVILRPGEGATWRADREFALVIGNAGGVTMTFDGKKFGPLGESGEVIRIELPWKGSP